MCHVWTHAPHKNRGDLTAAFLSFPISGIISFGMPILAQITSDDVLDMAYEWLCRRRRDYSANADVWEFRRCWPREKWRPVSSVSPLEMYVRRWIRWSTGGIDGCKTLSCRMALLGHSRPSDCERTLYPR
jgi:hypothetical protein